jgi:hypothetical protein
MQQRELILDISTRCVDPYLQLKGQGILRVFCGSSGCVDAPVSNGVMHCDVTLSSKLTSHSVGLFWYAADVTEQLESHCLIGTGYVDISVLVSAKNATQEIVLEDIEGFPVMEATVSMLNREDWIDRDQVGELKQLQDEFLRNRESLRVAAALDFQVFQSFEKPYLDTFGLTDFAAFGWTVRDLASEKRGSASNKQVSLPFWAFAAGHLMTPVEQIQNYGPTLDRLFYIAERWLKASKGTAYDPSRNREDCVETAAEMCSLLSRNLLYRVDHTEERCTDQWTWVLHNPFIYTAGADCEDLSELTLTFFHALVNAPVNQHSPVYSIQKTIKDNYQLAIGLVVLQTGENAYCYHCVVIGLDRLWFELSLAGKTPTHKPVEAFIVESTNHTTACEGFDETASEVIRQRERLLPWEEKDGYFDELNYKQSVYDSPFQDSYPLVLALFGPQIGTLFACLRSDEKTLGIPVESLLSYSTDVVFKGPAVPKQKPDAETALKYFQSRFPVRKPLPTFSSDPRAGITSRSPDYVLHTRSCATKMKEILEKASEIEKRGNYELSKTQLVLFDQPFIRCTELGYYKRRSIRDTNRSVSGVGCSGKHA